MLTKKIFLALIAVAIAWGTTDAQIVEIMNGETVVASFTSSQYSKVVFKEENTPTPKPEPEGVEAVDLGLPSGLKWANMNVGATTNTENGDYFAWGEIEPKSNYTEDTYKYYSSYTYSDDEGFDVTVKGYTKYVRSSQSSQGLNGFCDDKIVLEPEDDAAYMNWGGDWRMPTKAEQDELRNNCTWQCCALNGVNGYKVTGPNGNWIFLPAAGYRYGPTLDAGSDGNYRSSSLGLFDSSSACSLHFDSYYVGWNSYNRYNGRSVRPVCQ